LGVSTGKLAAGVTSTRLLADAIVEPVPVGCVIDAKRGLVYTALYGPSAAQQFPDEQSTRSELLAPEASTPEEGFSRLLRAVSGPIIIAGSGVPMYLGRFTGEGADRLRAAGPTFDEISPAVLAQACMAEFRAGRGMDVSLLEPLYVAAAAGM